MFQHAKGVIIALGIAMVVLFLLSLLIPQQLVLTNETVISAPRDSVYKVISDKENLPLWISDLRGIKLQFKGDEEIVFEGRDGNLYHLEFVVTHRAKGLELRYFKQEEKKAVFILTTESSENQTIIRQQQFWNLGINPLKKLLGIKNKDKSLKLMQKDMNSLKKYIEK